MLTSKDRAQKALARKQLRSFPSWAQKTIAALSLVIFIGPLVIKAYGPQVVSFFYLHPEPVTESVWQENNMRRTASGCFVVVPDEQLRPHGPNPTEKVVKITQGPASFVTGSQWHPPGASLWCVNTAANSLVGVFVRENPGLRNLPFYTYP